MRDHPQLVQIKEKQAVTKETHPEFWFHCQRAILLGLKEDGVLDEIQYRHAEEHLAKQCRRGHAKGGETLS